MRLIILLLALYVGSAFARPLDQSIIVYNTQTLETVHSYNENTPRPIASITKLMTAIVSLDSFNLSDRIRIAKNKTETVQDVLTRLLVRSDNSAAELLAKSHPQGRNGFLSAMNAKAKSMHLWFTSFNDPSGLSAENVSTATELAKLTVEAGKYDFIKHTTSQAVVNHMSNTNVDILRDFKNIEVSKTGFTSRAGRCLAMLAEIRGSKYAIIILGEPTKQVRNQIARNLLTTEYKPVKYYYEQRTETQTQSIIEQNLQAQGSYHFGSAQAWGLHP